MKCPNHPRNEVSGYCAVCGSFGCEECLKLHNGKVMCPKCYKPIGREIEANKEREEKRKRHPRQRLVVRFKDGRVLYGVCFALNPRDFGFHLDRVDSTGQEGEGTVHCQFSDLKAVFFVKSFDGKFDKHRRYQEWQPEGNEMVVEFTDGEVIRGFTLRRYDGNEDRFYLIPGDQSGNNISILVERSAVAGVYTPQEYKGKVVQQREERKQEVGGDSVDLSQEETMGDFYFETRNYPAALEQYQAAIKKYPQSSRLRKKMLLTTYNVGVQHIKRRDYQAAMKSMRAVLNADPENKHARKKIQQLKRILHKTDHKESAGSSRDREKQPPIDF